MCDWLRARGGSLSCEDLAGYRAIEREPVRMSYRDREVLTNPPPSAGGTLLAYALALPGPWTDTADAERSRRSDERPLRPSARRNSWKGCQRRDSSRKFLATRLGSTTHISVLDAEGWACSATCTNGEGSGVVVPGTRMHIEQRHGGRT